MESGAEVKRDSVVLCCYKKVNVLGRHDKYQIFKRRKQKEKKLSCGLMGVGKCEMGLNHRKILGSTVMLNCFR